MPSLTALIDRLLDRLAARLAVKVQAQLDGAFDAALQRAEQRLEAAALNLETRLVEAATRAIVGTGLQVGMESTLDRTEQIIDATGKALEATMFTAGVMVGSTKADGGGRVTPAVLDAAEQVQQQLRERVLGALPVRPRTWGQPERPDQ